MPQEEDGQKPFLTPDSIDAAIAALQKYRDELRNAEARESDVLRLKQENPYFKKTGTKRLAEFFFEKGYFIQAIEHTARQNYKLAQQIWSGRPVTVDFIGQFRKFSLKGENRYPLADIGKTEKNTLKILCREMAGKGWLRFREEDGDLIIDAVTGEGKNYLSGYWAEDVTRHFIAKALQENGFKSARVWQDIQLKRVGSASGNACDMQLDCLVEVNDRIYIFEIKSGVNMCIDKWVDRARLFNTDPHRFITCCMDEKLNYKIFLPYRLFYLPTLEKQFADLLKKDFGSPA